MSGSCKGAAAAWVVRELTEERPVGGGTGRKRPLSHNSEALICVISALLLSLGNCHHRSQLREFH